jgi:FkbM family methyltransferase
VIELPTWALRSRFRNLLRRLGYEVVAVSRHGPPASLLPLHLHQLFSRFEINCVVDVGASVGDFAVLLRHNGFDGHIASFEPVKASYDQLAHRAATDHRWTAHHIALGSYDGESEINVARGSFFSSFLMPNEYSRGESGPEAEVLYRESVDVRRLDGLFEGLFPVARPCVYLKLDTQGWDLEVLAGAQDSLAHIPALQTEVSMQAIYEGMPSFADSLAVLDRYGYVTSMPFPVNLDSRLAAVEFDWVAVRAPER